MSTSLVRLATTSDAHLKEYGGPEERGCFPGGGIADIEGAVSAFLGASDRYRLAADAGSSCPTHFFHQAIRGSPSTATRQNQDVDVFREPFHDVKAL